MLQSWLHSTEPVEPYTKLADIYDYAMRHVNYGKWASYLCKLFKQADGSVTRILDIACGTGSLVLRLSKAGFTVVGLDASFDMIRVAKSKNRDSVALWCARMDQFAARKSFDVALCTYDSMNYCLDRAAWQATLRNSSRAIRPGGLFIFDVCTQRNSRMNFLNYYENDGNDEFNYIRQSYYSSEDHIQTNEFVISPAAQGRAWYKEKHVQRIYTISDITKWIPNSLFSLIGVYDGFSFRPGSERSDRVHFVLKRKADHAC